MNRIYIKYLLPFLAIILLTYYILPILNYSKYMVSQPGDPVAHVALTKWFCDNFFRYNFINDDYFAPNGVNLSSGYESPLLFSVACIAYPLGPIAMFNLLAIFQVMLILFTSYLIANKFIKKLELQVAFIFLYSFSSYFLARTTAHINLLSMIWATSTIFYFFYDIDLKNIRKTLLSFVIIAATLLSSWQNWPTIIPLCVMLLIKNFFFGSKKTFEDIRRIFINIIFSCFVVTLLIAPFVYPILTTYSNSNREARIAGLYAYNADILSYVVPWEKNIIFPWFSQLFNSISNSRPGGFFEIYNSIDPLFCILFLIIITINIVYRNKKYLLLLFIALIYLILSLGPKVTFAGKYLLSLPYYLVISEYPPFSMTRTPARIGIVVVFCIYLYTIIFIDKYKPTKKNRILFKYFLVFLAAYGILYSTIFSYNTQVSHYEYRPAYFMQGLQLIKNDKSGKYLLDIPLAIGSNPSQDLLQLLHEKPIISGYISYASLNSEVLSYISKSPVFSVLGCGNQSFPYVQEKRDIFVNNTRLVDDSTMLFKYLIDENIGYIILYKQMLDEVTCAELKAMVEGKFVEPSVSLIDENIYFKVLKINNIESKKVNDKILFSLENMSTSWSQVWGVVPTRWIVGTSASMSIVSPDKREIDLMGEVIQLPNSKSNKYKVSINNQEWIFSTSDGKFRITHLPLNEGINKLVINVGFCDRPVDLKISEDTGCYSIGLKNISIIPH